ncbi:iron-sulfur cluster assembly scaffold protein [Patescibacteria group bacterium]
MNSLYSKKVMDHFKNPRNMGEIKNPDGEAIVGNPVCGDVMKMFIKVSQLQSGKGAKFIKDIKFQTLGCGAAIATSSMVTEMVKGKTLKEAQKIDKKKLVQALGGLPCAKLHCSVLAVEALKKAIINYQQN